MNVTLQGHSTRLTCVAWNDEHEVLASCDEEGTIVVWRKQDGSFAEEMQNSHPKSYARALQWSPNGAQIAFAYANGELMVGTVEGNRVWGKTVDEEENPGGLSKLLWTPDGKGLLVGNAAGEVRRYNAANGAFEAKVAFHCESPGPAPGLAGLAWGARDLDGLELDPPALALCYDNGKCQLMRNETDASPVVIDTGMNTASTAAWNPAGTVLAVAGMDDSVDKDDNTVEKPHVKFYNAAGQLLQALPIPGKVLPVGATAWVGDGTRILLTLGSMLYFANVVETKEEAPVDVPGEAPPALRVLLVGKPATALLSAAFPKAAPEHIDRGVLRQPLTSIGLQEEGDALFLTAAGAADVDEVLQGDADARFAHAPLFTVFAADAMSEQGWYDLETGAASLSKTPYEGFLNTWLVLPHGEPGWGRMEPAVAEGMWHGDFRVREHWRTAATAQEGFLKCLEKRRWRVHDPPDPRYAQHGLRCVGLAGRGDGRRVRQMLRDGARRCLAWGVPGAVSQPYCVRVHLPGAGEVEVVSSKDKATAWDIIHLAYEAAALKAPKVHSVHLLHLVDAWGAVLKRDDPVPLFTPLDWFWDDGGDGRAPGMKQRFGGALFHCWPHYTVAVLSEGFQKGAALEANGMPMVVHSFKGHEVQLAPLLQPEHSNGEGALLSLPSVGPHLAPIHTSADLWPFPSNPKGIGPEAQSALQGTFVWDVYLTMSQARAAGRGCFTSEPLFPLRPGGCGPLREERRAYSPVDTDEISDTALSDCEVKAKQVTRCTLRGCRLPSDVALSQCDVYGCVVSGAASFENSEVASVVITSNGSIDWRDGCSKTDIDTTDQW
eukprot:TRINITY_DN3739_c0_g3_i2.p1 TRINITY_DN3739_c0_g3~~TRINITY_DN3739_c0_g3_i2.p1  ORF type:complete len:831 (+),score=159.45 TRINITY_DN3739_c0_g3_i2:69-2561(+)